ncbi:hypothetical protein C8R44DRAFT_806851 [Mycena epipterygia]|nr:hypothetical protein C8R44DRAFT_806851 [Mycena epipterygia]
MKCMNYWRNMPEVSQRPAMIPPMILILGSPLRFLQSICIASMGSLMIVVSKSPDWPG